MPVQEFGFIKLRAFVGYEDSKNVSPNYIVEFPAFVCRDKYLVFKLVLMLYSPFLTNLMPVMS